MNVLVTGGAGYIGGTVAEQLVAAGHHVTVYDGLQRGHEAAIPTGAEFVRGDIGDKDRLEAVLSARPYQAILHFAALIEAGESMRDPGAFFDNNVCRTQNLLDIATRYGVERFVFSSSAGVYRSQDRPIRESDPIGPSSVYGQTKWMVEEMLPWYQQIYGLRYAALRYFNAAGATDDRGEDHRPETHIIPLVLQVALGQREKISIFGDDYPTPDGSCVRDYIHISDLASAHLLALDGLANHEQLVYNVGTGRGYSVKEVIDTAREVTGHPIPAVVEARRPGDPARLVADASNLKDELGWQPQIPDLRDIIASAWRWHQAHPHGYAQQEVS